VLTAAERACTLTKSLLAFGRKQEIATKISNLNAIVGGVEKMLTRLLREDIELRVILSEEELVIMGDQLQIEQILFNLAINSRDAMPSGGVISIRTDKFEIDQEFRNINGFGEPGKYALLIFSDNGMGMDEETLQRIFEPFFTTKDTGMGTGLGLSMCHGIVAQHNGYIECQSTPGFGTTFKIYLPLIAGKVESKQTLPGGLLPGGTEFILLAEDDRQLRSLCGKILTKQGYKVIEAEDGEDALNKFIEHVNDIRLVIVDCIMPKTNGKEVCREIAQLNPQMRFIFTSGYTADIFGEKDFEGLKIHFLPKPVKQSELLQCVRYALDGNS
jgi:two-component system cell cycle sensor histidine kinase/response regulator CckA